MDRVGKKVVRSYKSVATIEELTVFLEKAVADCLYEEPYVQISSKVGLALGAVELRSQAVT